MRIGFVGMGKFSRQLLRGWQNRGVVAIDGVRVYARSTASRERLDEALEGVRPDWVDEPAAVADADVVFIAVPPVAVASIVQQLGARLADRLCITFAAGVSLDLFREGLGPAARVIRCMPNTPVRVGAGMTPWARTAPTSDDDVACFERLFDPIGRVIEVEERYLDAITAVSGSGPAYVYHFMEALSRAAVEQGLPQDLAHELVAQTFIGAARMVQVTRLPPEHLAAQVKTPGGTTLAACEVLEQGDLNGLVTRAIAAARRRAGELGS